MRYQSFFPNAALASYISHIMVIESCQREQAFELPLYANGMPTLVFQTTTADKSNGQVGHLTLYGQAIRPDQLIFQSDFTLIAYFFHPYCLPSLFGFKASELTGECIDSSLLKQSRFFCLEEALLNARSLHDRIQLMNRFIGTLAASNDIEDSRIVAAVNYLNNPLTARSLVSIQQELNITERSLQRLFDMYVGVSPKMYKRICQFQAAFQQLNGESAVRLIDITYDHSFADQSHFIRVFKEFTGLTPREYLVKRAAYVP